MHSMRGFVAIELPDGVKREIGEVQEQLKRSGARAAWTRPEGIHLTLKFLGEVPESGAVEVLSALRDAAKGTASFTVAVTGAGGFPSERAPRVIWLGVEGATDQLAALQAAVDSAMAGLGFAREDRKFSPHLTLARVKYPRPRDDWQQVIESIRDVRLAEFPVKHISLMKSELRPTGAVYTEVGRAELGGRVAGETRDEGNSAGS